MVCLAMKVLAEDRERKWKFLNLRKRPTLENFENKNKNKKKKQKNVFK